MIKTYKLGSDKEASPILLIVPHGAYGREFFRRFPKIFGHSLVQKRLASFENFLRIEQDYGSLELAKAIGDWLFNHSGGNFEVEICEILYPRAIVDGGRITSHCLRACLPHDVMSNYRDEFITMHDETVTLIREKVVQNKKRGGIFLDIHTMAPYTPNVFCSSKGGLTESFESLDDYVAQFTESKNVNRDTRRFIDLIAHDGEGHMLADERLLKLLAASLQGKYEIAYSEPFKALGHYMMHDYMKQGRGLAIDVPKDYLSLEDFNLLSFKLDEGRIDKLAQAIGKGVAAFFGS